MLPPRGGNTDPAGRQEHTGMGEGAGSTPASSPGRRLLMIYVNIPFCRSKCAFCDYVQPIPPGHLMLTAGDATRQRYIEALCTEIRVRGAEMEGGSSIPHVIYWGGGTASILEPDEIVRIASALRESFDLGTVVESTIECSPDTIDPDKLALFRSLGFNRFSSGVQSLDDWRLRQLGRRHTSEEARRGVRWAREAGFENVNVDIMCGFPDETLQEVRHTVSAALDLGADHVSLYPFRPTPGTAIRRQIDRDSKDLYVSRQKLAFALGQKMITDAGYLEYASGYFGRPSLFALMYFQMSASLVGFGSGAMSLFDQRFRTHTKGKLHEYVERPAHYDVDLPASADPVVISSLRAGLSCFGGVLRDDWECATGSALDEVLERPVTAPLLEYFRSRGLVEDARGLRLPPDQVANALIDLTFQLLGQNLVLDTPVTLSRTRSGVRTGPAPLPLATQPQS